MGNERKGELANYADNRTDSFAQSPHACNQQCDESRNSIHLGIRLRCKNSAVTVPIRTTRNNSGLRLMRDVN